MKSKLILIILMIASSMAINTYAEGKDTGNNGSTNPDNPITDPGGRPNSNSGPAIHYYIVEGELYLYTTDSAMAGLEIYDAVTGVLLQTAYTDLCDGYSLTLPGDHPVFLKLTIAGKTYSYTI